MSHSHPSVTSSKHFPHIECGPEFQYLDRQRELVRGPAFDLWANEHRHEQLRKHSKTTPDQLTRILCDLWDQLPQAERDIYLERTGSAPLSSNKSNQEMEPIKPGVNIDPSYKLNKRTINLEQELGGHHEQGEGEKQLQEQWQKEKPSDEFDAEKQLSMKERLTDTLSTLATNVTDKLPTSVQNMLHLKTKEESGETIPSADTNVPQTNQPSSKLNKPEVEMSVSENQESLSSLDESSKDQEASSLKSKLGLNKLTDKLSDVSDSLQSKVHHLKDSIKQQLHLGGQKIDTKDSGMLGKEEVIHTDAPTDEETNKEAPKDVESTGTSGSLLGGVSNIVSSIKENVVGKEDERLPEKPAAPVWKTEEIQKGGLDTEESSFGIKETMESLSEPSAEQGSGISGGSRKSSAFSTQAPGLPKNVKHRFSQSQHHQEPKQTHLAPRQGDSGGEGKQMNKSEKMPHELHPETGFEMTHEKHKDVNLADSSLSQLTENDALQMQSRQRALDALQKAKVKEAQQTGVKHDLKGKEDALSGKKQDSASANLHQLLSGTHHEPGKNKQKQGKKWAKGKYHMQEEIGNIAREGNFHLTPESNKHDKRVAYQHSEIKHVPYEPQPKGRT